MEFDLSLNVFLQNNDYVKQLEQQVEQLERDNAEWKRKYQRLDVDYSYIASVNLELIDTMKLNGYKFRKQSDVRTWDLKRGE